MSDQINDGGPAFPAAGMTGRGMSLRDHFAGQFMAALIGHENKDYCTRGKSAVPTLAKYAVEYADALIAELARRQA